jgi:hypothetical protein
MTTYQATDNNASQATVELDLSGQQPKNTQLAIRCCLDCFEGICARHKGIPGSPIQLQDKYRQEQRAEAESFLIAEGLKIIGSNPEPALFPREAKR